MPGWELIGEEERRAVNEVFDNGGVLFRQSFDAMRNNMYKVRDFESAFAKYCGSSYAHAVTSGTAALKVALIALGVKPGDEVVTQSHTFVATVEAILDCGAVPIITDIDDSLNMAPEDLERKITAKTKVIVPVHMLGATGRMDRILEIAQHYGIPIVEDAAQACGGRYRGTALGTLGKVGIFSFDHGKILTTGEGGMIVTNDQAIYQNARTYADHGHENNPAFPRGEDTRSFPGFNYRMMELQGAIGVAQLKKLPGSIETHRSNKQALKTAIQREIPDLQFRSISDPSGDAGDSLVFFLKSAEQAKRVARRLQQKGIGFKNLPDALNWHFAGTWDHLLAGMDWLQGRTLEDYFRPSGEILRRAIALPIFYKLSPSHIESIALELKTALSE